MNQNRSPWIHELKRTRPAVVLDRDFSADVAIVGGGIAGVVTAYFTLRDTKHSVVLLEADKVAHGATGHNAGQVVSYFERSFASLVDEFGLALATEGQQAVESAWSLIDQIFSEANLKTPLYRFSGYAGCSTLPQVLTHLENNVLRAKGGLPIEAIHIADESGIAKDIPEAYREFFSVLPQANILDLLETNNPSFIASLTYQKGCMNSALFTEELVQYLLANFSNRFSLFEQTPVREVVVEAVSAQLQTNTFKVMARRVILCTNGFENFSIRNTAGPEINTAFHHLVNGRIGTMAGYVEPLNHPPTAISYLPKPAPATMADPTGETYFFFSRRPLEYEAPAQHNLISVNGPERVLPNDAVYDRTEPGSSDDQFVIDQFLRDTYRHYPADGGEFVFCWHGLMGYTPNGVRRVGSEPRNMNLLYNLGCNGVGILPSIYGGWRISQLLEGKKLGPSIFDPVDRELSN